MKSSSHGNPTSEAEREVVGAAGIAAADVVSATWTPLDEARQYLSLAVDLHRDGKWLTSGRYAKRALSLFERASRTVDYDAIVARLCLADSRRERGDFARAESDYREALSTIGCLVAERASVDVRNVRARALSGLGNVALAGGEMLETERQLLSALDTVESKGGSPHESSAMLMDDLGTLYRHTGRHDEAARMHHLALTIVERTLGAEHPRAATVLEHMALVEHARARFVDGELLARQAIAIQKKTFGSDHPRLANAFVVLASMLEGQRKPLEASQMRQAAELIVDHWFGDDVEAFAGKGLVPGPMHARSDCHDALGQSSNRGTASAHAL
jgi:tetratricopeptide (TPR) repeat protein